MPQARLSLCTRSLDFLPDLRCLGTAQHLFLWYQPIPDDNGYVLRAGPKNLHLWRGAPIVVTYAPYTPAHPDYSEHPLCTPLMAAHPAVVAEYMERMEGIAASITSQRFVYIPLCHPQNSNTVIKTLLQRAHVPLEVPLTQLDRLLPPSSVPGGHWVRGIETTLVYRHMRDWMRHDPLEDCFEVLNHRCTDVDPADLLLEVADAWMTSWIEHWWEDDQDLALAWEAWAI